MGEILAVPPGPSMQVRRVPYPSRYLREVHAAVNPKFLRSLLLPAPKESRQGSTPKPLFSTRQLNRFESTEIPGKFVAGRLDSTPTPDTLLLLPSGIRVSGVESWVRKLAELMPSLTLTPQEMACVTYGH